MSAAAERLGALGRALGGMRWVQGPGGNVSIKDGAELLVKASGVRLSDVGAAHARVPLADARLATAGDAAADARTFAVAPRPSLETYFHAIGDVVVAHTHATGVLLSACATRPLSDLGVPRVPYARPGRGIALAVEPLLASAASAAGASDGTRAVVLESHGLIVYAPTIEAAIARTIALDDAARAPFGPLPDLDATLADALRSEEIAVEGGVARALPDRAPPPPSGPRYLFPDAVVYASVLLVDEVSPEVAGRAARELPRPAVLVDPRGRRVVAAKKSLHLAYAVEVALAHDWVEDALAPRGLARHLPDDEPAKILDLPSEQYRMRL